MPAEDATDPRRRGDTPREHLASAPSAIDDRLDRGPDRREIDAGNLVVHGGLQQVVDALAVLDLSFALTTASDVEGRFPHQATFELAIEEGVDQTLGVAAGHANSLRRAWSFFRA
jgi:hypothetical protein